MSPTEEKSHAAAIKKKARGAFPSLTAPRCPELTEHRLRKQMKRLEICAKAQGVKEMTIS